MHSAKKILYSLDTTRYFINFRVCLGVRLMQPLKTTGMETFCDCHSLAEQQNCNSSLPVASAHDRGAVFCPVHERLEGFQNNQLHKVGIKVASHFLYSSISSMKQSLQMRVASQSTFKLAILVYVVAYKDNYIYQSNICNLHCI